LCGVGDSRLPIRILAEKQNHLALGVFAGFEYR
jgi:hypothetical protein